MAREDAETVLARRSTERGQAARDALRAEVPGAKAELMALDLASLASVERFVAEFAERYQRLAAFAEEMSDFLRTSEISESKHHGDRSRGGRRSPPSAR
ncbi:MAG: hypothetical protein F4Z77_09795 [Dehalococcoidia bacterium]|nr:hypothetical protein [Dehalococcoidia bacterium]MYA52999.1 hypothetical protein [Dehalococcoidia bacterium]